MQKITVITQFDNIEEFDTIEEANEFIEDEISLYPEYTKDDFIIINEGGCDE